MCNKKNIAWLFGRGASISCGLNWEEPGDWRTLNRSNRITKIQENLKSEVKKIFINNTPYSRLISSLKNFPTLTHLFLTTNWDNLLEQTVQSYGWPQSLIEPHIFHLNGFIEQSFNSNRSAWLLPEDGWDSIKKTYERNQAVQHLIMDKWYFVIIGLSFKCNVDQFILEYLEGVQDDLPVGDSDCIIIEPDKRNSDIIERKLQQALPRAQINTLNVRFEDFSAEQILECFKNDKKSESRMLTT